MTTKKPAIEVKPKSVTAWCGEYRDGSFALWSMCETRAETAECLGHTPTAAKPVRVKVIKDQPKRKGKR